MNKLNEFSWFLKYHKITDIQLEQMKEMCRKFRVSLHSVLSACARMANNENVYFNSRDLARCTFEIVAFFKENYSIDLIEHINSRDLARCTWGVKSLTIDGPTDEVHDFDDQYTDFEGDESVLEALKYLEGLKLSNPQITQLDRQFMQQFDTTDRSIFYKAVLELRDIPCFAASGNVFTHASGISNEALFVMRWIAGMKMEEILEVLKFDLNDSNLMQDLTTGNIGTPQRWAKSITGSNIEDDSEIMCGRYTKTPRIQDFEDNYGSWIPVTKKVDIMSVCGHHFLPYSTLLKEGSYAVISYIPKNGRVLGISKLQRLADWVSRRPTIQESLTKDLWTAVSKAAGTEDVYVGIFNSRHTCEYLRGSQSHNGDFTTEHYGGVFKKLEVRQSVYNTNNGT